MVLLAVVTTIKCEEEIHFPFLLRLKPKINMCLHVLDTRWRLCKSKVLCESLLILVMIYQAGMSGGCKTFQGTQDMRAVKQEF